TFTRLQQLGQLVSNDFGDDLSSSMCPQDFFGLSLKLWFCQTNGNDCRQASQNVVLFNTIVSRFQTASISFNGLTEHPGQGLVEPGVVRTTLWGRNNIDETSYFSVVTHVPAQGHINFTGTFDILHMVLSCTVKDRYAFANVSFDTKA